MVLVGKCWPWEGWGVIGAGCYDNISDYKRDVGNFFRVEKEVQFKYVESQLSYEKVGLIW